MSSRRKLDYPEKESTSGSRSNRALAVDQQGDSAAYLDSISYREPQADQSDLEEQDSDSNGNSETEEGPSELKEQNADSNDSNKNLAKDFAAKASITPKQDDKPDEVQDGEWLSGHPWESRKPDPNLKMKDTVANSTSYPTSSNWTNCKGEVDLAKIFPNLPKFTEDEMKGAINSGRQELEQLVAKIKQNTPTKEILKSSPTIIEVNEKHEGEYYSENKTPGVRKEKFKAFWLCSSPVDPKENNNFYLDCEFMLRMYVPESLSSWFDIQRCDAMQWIRKISDPNKEKRWMFIPSYRRARVALLDWSGDETVTEESTIRILVARPSEFDEYVKYCGYKFPVICLPQDDVGVGYPRYWIQKIALRLKLQFIWMVDDSVECFYEYDPERSPPEGSFKKWRRRKFGLVFKRIEDFVKEADDSDKPIAAMSPRRWNPMCKPKKPFVCKPPQCAVYLNLRTLSEKNIYYRPELTTLEDMIFAYECEKKGLKVFMDNRVHLQDHAGWKNSGASSPTVKNRQVKQETAATPSGGNSPSVNKSQVKQKTAATTSSRGSSSTV